MKFRPQLLHTATLLAFFWTISSVSHVCAEDKPAKPAGETVPATGETTLTLTVTTAEANLIMEALGGLPFARTHGLIAKIQTQAREQLTQQNKPEKPKKPQ